MQRNEAGMESRLIKMWKLREKGRMKVMAREEDCRTELRPIRGQPSGLARVGQWR